MVTCIISTPLPWGKRLQDAMPAAQEEDEVKDETTKDKEVSMLGSDKGGAFVTFLIKR